MSHEQVRELKSWMPIFISLAIAIFTFGKKDAYQDLIVYKIDVVSQKIDDQKKDIEKAGATQQLLTDKVNSLETSVSVLQSNCQFIYKDK